MKLYYTGGAQKNGEKIKAQNDAKRSFEGKAASFGSRTTPTEKKDERSGRDLSLFQLLWEAKSLIATISASEEGDTEGLRVLSKGKDH